MSLVFEPIRLHQQAAYLACLEASPQRTSDYSFANVWGWAEAYDLHWAWADHLVWLRQNKPETTYWAPVGDWVSVDWQTCMAEHFKSDAVFDRIPQRLADIWEADISHRIRVKEARGQWDYLYSARELASLKGNRFHKKKNLVNQFLKKYDHTYMEMSPDIIDRALAMQSDWCLWRDCESHDTLIAENVAIEKVLNAWEKLRGITGGALIVEDQMVAYTVAERLDAKNLLIHFEKADPAFKGAYQAINRMFAEHADTDIEWINREQDLDDEGLRKAKLSYRPVDFLKKYRVTLSA